jgi:simple sugar transport system permease protein
MGETLGWWGVPLAILGGAIRVGTPLLWVSLGETVTEKAGRINLGLEGTLLMGAMTAYAVSLLSGNPWLGILAAAGVGMLFGALHGMLCSLARVNDTAMGIALMLAGSGLAFWLGKPLIQPAAPDLPAIAVVALLGGFTDQPAVQAALAVNPLFAIGVVLAFIVHWALKNTRFGLRLRVVGDSENAARAFGLIPTFYRVVATAFGGACAGVGGASLSLVYPGAWSEALSSGQGGGAGDLCALGPAALHRGRAAVRRRECHQPGAAGPGLQPGLLPLRRPALCADAGPADRPGQTRPQPWRAR